MKLPAQIQVEHLTPERNWSLRPILIPPLPDGLGIKPSGALYTSPVESGYGWRHWIRDEDFHVKEYKYRVLLTVNLSHCFLIDSYAQMLKLPWHVHPQHDFLRWVDYSELAECGYQCVWLTEYGQSATRLTHPYSLYGWDCETVAILDTACILDWKVDHAPQRRRVPRAAQAQP